MTPTQWTASLTMGGAIATASATPMVLSSGGSLFSDGRSIAVIGQPLIGLTAAQPTGLPSAFLGFVPCALANSCPADLDDGSGTGSHDDAVTIDDLLFFLTAFESGDVRADLDNGSGTGVRDGGVTVDDLLYFLIHFEAGC